MTKYNVHLYREMRLAFKDIEASSPEEAAQIAATMTDDEAESIEDCQGDNIAALVDTVGDEDYTLSVVVDFKSATDSERHIEALRYYANTDNYNDDGAPLVEVVSEGVHHQVLDLGKTAKDALCEVGL